MINFLFLLFPNPRRQHARADRLHRGHHRSIGEQDSVGPAAKRTGIYGGRDPSLEDLKISVQDLERTLAKIQRRSVSDSNEDYSASDRSTLVSSGTPVSTRSTASSPVDDRYLSFVPENTLTKSNSLFRRHHSSTQHQSVI